MQFSLNSPLRYSLQQNNLQQRVNATVVQPSVFGVKNWVSNSRLLYILLFLCILSGCGGSNDDSSLILTENPSDRNVSNPNPIALAYLKRCTTAPTDAIDAIKFCAGGDLFYRTSTNPGTEEINITAIETEGAGDVQSVSPSFDGESLVLSMRRPEDNTFNIWLYDIASSALTSVLINDEGDDIDPAFLPDGRIVFSSNRQQRSRALLDHQSIEPYTYVDEYGRNTTYVLHTISTNGLNLQQITFNLSHDRFPSVASDGRILFSRWSHVGSKSRYDIYHINPDGSGLFIKYGAFSEGNSHLSPFEMEDGRLMSTVTAISGSHQAGAVMVIDTEHFDEQSKFNTSTFINRIDTANLVDQYQPTDKEIPLGDEISASGRFASAYPLWDGSNRFIASYQFTSTDESTNLATGELSLTETGTKYQLVIVDMGSKTMQSIALAEGDQSILKAVIIQTRPTPPTTPIASTPEQRLNTENFINLALTPGDTPTGIINVLSVYDTDSGYLARMDASVLAENLGETIPTTSPSSSTDTRSEVADISTLKDPAQSTANDRPARYFRITKGIPMPAGVPQDVIGETDYEMRQIVGYGTVQPDGSIRAIVPADTPITIEVLDKEGRAFAPHQSWLQVRPGETRTCNGCHSPRDGNPINSVTIQSKHINSNFQPDPEANGKNSESMAETLARVTSGGSMILSDTPSYTDVWTRPSAEPDPSEQLAYVNVPVTPVNGIINYPDHIQPIWDRLRGGTFNSDTCTNCHKPNNDIEGTNGSAGLDLTNTEDDSRQLTSYQFLLLGKLILDEENSTQIYKDDSGKIRISRKAPLVTPGLSRASILTEVLYNTEIKAEFYDLDQHFLDHSTLDLSKGELRIINEWIDLGAQYYNTPFEAGAEDNVTRGYELDQSEIRRPSMNSAQLENAKQTFTESIHPILLDNCGYCHRPQPADDAPQDITSSVDLHTTNQAELPGNRFLLTGHWESDFNATLSMISNYQTPEDNILLLNASELNNRLFAHPNKPNIVDPTASGIGAAEQSGVFLPQNGNDYRMLLNWISDFTGDFPRDEP